MPIVEISLLEGRTKEQKRKLMISVTEAVVESTGAPIESVRVILREMPPEHFCIAGVPKG